MQEEDVVVDKCSSLTVDNQIREKQTVDWDKEEPAEAPVEVLSFPVDKNTRVEGETEHQGNDGTDGQREVNRINQQLESSSHHNIYKLSFIWTFTETLEIISRAGVTAEDESARHRQTHREGDNTSQDQ